MKEFLMCYTNCKYNYFIKKIAEVKRFNLDEESLFIEFNEDILNG